MWISRLNYCIFIILFFFLPLCFNISLSYIIFHLCITFCSGSFYPSASTFPLEQRFLSGISTSLGFSCLQWLHLPFQLQYLFLQFRKHFTLILVLSSASINRKYIDTSDETVLQFSIANWNSSSVFLHIRKWAG